MRGSAKPRQPGSSPSGANTGTTMRSTNSITSADTSRLANAASDAPNATFDTAGGEPDRERHEQRGDVERPPHPPLHHAPTERADARLALGHAEHDERRRAADRRP